MKIIRTIESFYPYMTGPANQAFKISSGLEKKGIKSPIFTTDYKAEKKPKHERKKGIEVLRFPIKWKLMKFFYTPTLERFLEKQEFDAIHSHSYRSYQTQIAYKTAKSKNKPFIISNHGTFISYRFFVKGLKKLPYILSDIFFKKAALNADAVIVNSRQEFNEAVEFGISRKKIHIIPVGIDAEKYKPLKKTGKTLNFLWVGRITRDRNIELLLKAVKLLEKENIKLKIIGNEYKRTESDTGSEIKRLKNMVKDMGLNQKVEFIPWTEKRAINEFRKADIFAYTSLWENFGQSILEAAAAGLPIICTKTGVALDLIDQGKTGYFVGHDKPKQVAKAILAFSNRRKREQASKLLRYKVKKEYDWNKIMKNYINIYNSLAKKRRRK